jgi:hypothetical protein
MAGLDKFKKTPILITKILLNKGVNVYDRPGWNPATQQEEICPARKKHTNLRPKYNSF